MLFDARLRIRGMDFVQTRDSAPFTVGTHGAHIRRFSKPEAQGRATYCDWVAESSRSLTALASSGFDFAMARERGRVARLGSLVALPLAIFGKRRAALAAIVYATGWWQDAIVGVGQ